MTLDQIGLIAGFVFTLMIFSYLLGDNFLYRLAVYIFAGIASGYITVVTIEGVVLPWIRATIGTGELSGIVVGVVPLALGALLLLKGFRRYSRLGNVALGFLIGVGAAVGLVGAISGTLLPLISDTARSLQVEPGAGDSGLQLFNGFLIVGGVICTLIFFGHFGRRNADGTITRGPVGRTLGTVGQGFVVVALAALYAGAIITGLAILSERLAYMLTTIGGG